MSAVILFLPAPAVTSLSLYFTVALLLVVGMVFAPQAIKRDRRVVALLLVIIAVVVIGQGVQAVYSDICNRVWWSIECWIAGWGR